MMRRRHIGGWTLLALALTLLAVPAGCARPSGPSPTRVVIYDHGQATAVEPGAREFAAIGSHAATLVGHARDEIAALALPWEAAERCTQEQVAVEVVFPEPGVQAGVHGAYTSALIPLDEDHEPGRVLVYLGRERYELLGPADADEQLAALCELVGVPAPGVRAGPLPPTVAPVSLATPIATPAATPTPRPTATATPAATVTPRPTATATPTTTPPPCLAAVTSQPAPPVRPLRFVYAEGGTLWRWEEETGQAVAYALSGEAYDACLSSDGQLIAFRRPAGERVDEVWVVGVDGEGERRLATFSAEETAARYRWTGAVDLVLDWLPGVHTLACHYEPDHRFVEYGPYEPLHLVDAESGALRTVSAAADEVCAFAYAPGGRQVAVLTAQDLRLVDARSGEVCFRVPVKVHAGRSQSLAYSPDGRYVVVFTERAVTAVDAADGSRHDIPFDYEPIGMGQYSLYPGINWLGEAPVFYTAFGQGNAVEVLRADATFAVWRVDVAAASATALGTYSGSFVGSAFSPDRRWLACRLGHSGNTYGLCLADVQGGGWVAYATDGRISVRGWNPDSTRFIYQQDERTTLGHICSPPRVLAGVEPDPLLLWRDTVWWVDTERFLTVNGDYSYSSPETWTLRLNSLDGEVTRVATLHGNQARYGYYLEE